MRALYLEINGQQADLPTSIKGLIKLMQAQNALAELETRVGEYSWPLTLPRTRRNCALFGQKQHLQLLEKFRVTDYTYELRCGSQVFRGAFRLSSVKNGFTGQLLGEGFSWALQLADKKLTDLRFEEVAYDGSQLEAILACDCDATDLQFPLISYGNFFIPATTKRNAEGEEEEVPTPPQAVISYPLSADDWYYGVYYRNIIKQIFKEIGWQLQGNVLESAEVREWVMTPAGADQTKIWNWGGLLPASAKSERAQTFDSYAGAGPGDGFNNNAVAFDEENEVAYFLPATPTPVLPGGTRALTQGAAEYTAPVEGVYSFFWSATISAASQVVQEHNQSSPSYADFFAPVLVALVAFRDGEGYEDADGGICANLTRPVVFDENQTRVLSYRRLDNGSDYSLKTGYFEGSAIGVYLAPGDVVRLLFFTRRRTGVDQQGGWSLYTRREFHLTTSGVGFACTYFDGPLKIQPANGLPPLLQKDVVKDFMTRTNTVPVPDFTRKIVRLLHRDEQQEASGAALELSDLVDPEEVECVPVLGVGVGVLRFSPAQAEDPLVKAGTDQVVFNVGSGAQEKQVTSLFAPVALRSYRLPRTLFSPPALLSLPTISTEDTLKQNCSEVEWDLGSLAPHLVRYQGTDATKQVPFMLRRVPATLTDWSGALAWDGEAGAVAQFYAGTVEQALRGHVAKFPACLTPAQYRQLTPGREVWLFGAQYTAEAVSGFDPADEAGQTSVELLRVI